jgi:hypothetical protein
MAIATNRANEKPHPIGHFSRLDGAELSLNSNASYFTVTVTAVDVDVTSLASPL